MNEGFNFFIQDKGVISSLFLQNNVGSFEQAMQYLRQLPYGRNKNKHDLTTVFSDNCGTCSTKHAVLKRLAEENNQADVKLVLGIFNMGKNYAARVGAVLTKYKLDHIPEAHNYLRINDGIIDCTTTRSSAEQFINEVVIETEIEPAQITDFKVNFHKQYLKEWLAQQTELFISFDELWNIREECIAALSEG